MEFPTDEQIYRGLAVAAILTTGTVISFYYGYKNKEEELKQDRETRDSPLESKSKKDSDKH